MWFLEAIFFFLLILKCSAFIHKIYQFIIYMLTLFEWFHMSKKKKSLNYCNFNPDVTFIPEDVKGCCMEEQVLPTVNVSR